MVGAALRPRLAGVKPRIQTGRGISGALRYVKGQGRDPKTGRFKTLEPGEESRAELLGGTGFGFDIVTEADAELARKMMEYAALNQGSKTRKCEQDCLHLTLSWERGEKPTKDEKMAAARSALAALGMGNAMALVYSHNDEDYEHVHIVASKINPETRRAYDLAGSWRKASVWAEQYEREHGGVININRQSANELRQAIADRDVDGVLEAMTKRNATFTARQLESALQKEIHPEIGAAAGQKHSVELERAQFANTILSHANVVQLADQFGGPTTRYTTRAVLEAELHVLRAADGLKEKAGHAIDDLQRLELLARPKYRTITREQTSAFRHATGAEGLAIIDGQAGTGKSFTMAAIREAYEGAGHHVIGLGPTNKVAKTMANDGFAHAKTVHSELFALNNGRTSWDPKTVVIVDEAAMLDTKLMAMVTAHAHDAGAKLILVGDDRQLSSIDRGGMFARAERPPRRGGAVGSQAAAQARRAPRGRDDGRGKLSRRAEHLPRQGRDPLDAHPGRGPRRAGRAMGEGHGSRPRQIPLRVRLHQRRREPAQRRLARGAQGARRARMGRSRDRDRARPLSVRAGDRIQFTGTDKQLGIDNGAAGTIEAIDGTHLAVKLDGRDPKTINFDAANFDQFRHGYAGTIYKGQGGTLDQTYLYHSEHWRSAPTYVALTRHREKAELFVARNTAADIKQLARQMARTDDRRAASMFHQQQPIGPVRPMTAAEILAAFGGEIGRHERDRPHTVAQAAAEMRGARTARPLDRQQQAPSANQNEQKPPLTREAIERDPWNAVALDLPADADHELLFLVSTAARELQSRLAERGNEAVTPEQQQLWFDLAERAKARQAGAEMQIVALDAARRPQAKSLTLDDIAERVQRILDDPTREADEHDDSVLQALQERRAADIEAEQRSAAAGQEELTAGTSGGDDEPERSTATGPIEDTASSQALSDDAQVEYDEWTGERLGDRGQDRDGTQPLYDKSTGERLDRGYAQERGHGGGRGLSRSR